ncbi:MAG: hypothetical protein HYS27_18885 [Deltaproteobacteria bacterium]|nr:hypothetical protein [Deltaproteobacteria bacterium]
MPGNGITELLIDQGAVTQDVVARAAQVPAHVSTSLVGRLIAAGADADKVVRAVAEIVGLPVANRVLIASAAKVPLPQPIARTLRELGACPVRRDERGAIQVVVGDPEARGAVEDLLPGCRVYLAPEPHVRQLLAELIPFGSSIPEGMPVEGFDVDMELSARLSVAPMPGPSMQPAAPSALPADPLQPRASGPLKARRQLDADDETMRVQRSPRAKSPGPPQHGAGAPLLAALDEPTAEDASPPAAAMAAAFAAVRKRWFLYGAAVGASVMAVLAALVVAAIEMSR